MNPIVFKVSSALCDEESTEIVDVGTRASDEYFDPIVNWDNAVNIGSDEFSGLVGPANIDIEGPNEGKYRKHFDFRGMPNRIIVEEAER